MYVCMYVFVYNCMCVCTYASCTVSMYFDHCHHNFQHIDHADNIY